MRTNSGDWPEDFGHENGNYLCQCDDCNENFTGYKRRRQCKECFIKGVINERDGLRAKLQTAEQQLAGLQEKLIESEFHAEGYRQSFEEMKAASIASANRANAAEQQLGQVREEVRELHCLIRRAVYAAEHLRDKENDPGAVEWLEDANKALEEQSV